MRDLVDDIAVQYLTNVRVKDAYLSASCPFHKSGTERHPSFWVNRDTGGWGCFTCHEGGSDVTALLRALGVMAVGLERQLNEIREDLRKKAKTRRTIEKAKALTSFKATNILPDALLGVFDWEPVSLIEDEGFDAQLLAEHGIGYDRERERITYPIRDIYGNLAGISGRQPDGRIPKYKIYTGWQVVDGRRHPNELGEDFPNYQADDIKNHLWRGNFVYDDLLHNRHDQLIVVEGYKAALRLVQLGWFYTVAVMGSALTAQQTRLVNSMGCDTWVFFDNNEAGRRGAEKACAQIAKNGQRAYRCHYYEEMPEWVQPSDLEKDEVEEILSTATLVVGGSYGKRKMERFKAR